MKCFDFRVQLCSNNPDYESLIDDLRHGMNCNAATVDIERAEIETLRRNLEEAQDSLEKLGTWENLTSRFRTRSTSSQYWDGQHRLRAQLPNRDQPPATSKE